jgi:hypothetical protein
MSSSGFSQAGAPLRMAYQSHWWHRFVNNIIQKKFPMLARSGISFNLFPAFEENLDRINKIHRMG